MKLRQIEIMWDGPFKHEEVIGKFHNGGNLGDGYSGEDYGLYQIYGPHILHKDKTLLYIGQAPDQTFSDRMFQHYKDWLYGEEGLEIYLGRIKPQPDDKDGTGWENDIQMAEAILIYKYTPNYNSCLKQEYPDLYGYENVRLFNRGNRNLLQNVDNAPADYQYKKVILKTIKHFKDAMKGER